jgi:hypothetical protein
MARLNVSATIHPLDVNYVLVAVEDEVGEPVNGLAEKNFEVDIWASSSYAPGVFSLARFRWSRSGTCPLWRPATSWSSDSERSRCTTITDNRSEQTPLPTTTP